MLNSFSLTKETEEAYEHRLQARDALQKRAPSKGPSTGELKKKEPKWKISRQNCKTFSVTSTWTHAARIPIV